MSLDITNLLISSGNSSLKVLKEDTGTISFGAIGSLGGSVWQTVTVPHGYPNDNLLWQVAFRETDGNYHNAMVTPFEAGDGSLNAFATLDGVNLYINLGWQVNSSLPATSFEYVYRILIP